MKTVAMITGRANDFSLDKPMKDKNIDNSYILMSKIAGKYGLKLVFGNPLWVKKGYLEKGWFYDKKWRKFKNKKIDYIYRFFSPLFKKYKKSVKEIEKIPGMNPTKFDILCWDKLKTYKLVKKFSPKTYKIKSKKYLLKKAKLIKSKKVIIKPKRGIRGLGVEIINKKNLIHWEFKKGMILQEFIDMAKGVPKFNIKGSHDLRILMINGKIDHCYFRIAKKGSMLANCAKGATKKIIDIEHIPKEVLNIVERINKKLKYYPRVNSIDFVFKNGKIPLVLELESQPGFFYYTKKQEKYRINYFNNLFKAIKELI
jgi:glutathione synthase/RimK-type ligase-like ATP-grasp enzyme